MAVERTFAIIKPDAVARNAIGGIVGIIEGAGLRVVGMRQALLDETRARGFYHVHKDRPFFADLVRFMTSGPCVLMALEGEGAVARWREIMGPTDSRKAPAGTVRHKYGTDVERNAVHGSDGADTARFELGYFFAASDLL